MTPYYQDASVTLYHGDAREIAPTLVADGCVIVSDAPYGIGLKYDGFDDTEDSVRSIAEDLSPSILSARRAAIFSGVPQMWMWPRPSWVLCWSYYPATNEFSPWGVAQWQPILAYGRDPYLERGLGPRPTVISYARPPDKRGTVHPCPKPLGLMTAVVDRVTAPTDVVLDMFAGSGTTLRAAKDLGRVAVGIESSERYCEEIARRLSQEVLDLGAA